MRIESNKNNKTTAFYELNFGVPFYLVNVPNERETLFMKTSEFGNNPNDAVNAVAVKSGMLVNIDRFQDVEIAKVHVESDKE